MTKSADDAGDLVSIGQLASATGVTSRTIRYYEELGILPEARRSPGGTRKYPRDYGGYIEAALALKDLGFRLEEIKPLARLAAGRTVTASQRDTAARLVEEKIEMLARQVTVLRRLHDSVRVPDAEVPVSAVLGSSAASQPALPADTLPAAEAEDSVDADNAAGAGPAPLRAGLEYAAVASRS
jgi:MerR family transcriptional regulator, copper efflux regulator